MANFSRLRDALEEDPFLGGGPMGDIADVEPSPVDHGDTTLVRASGLRTRPPVPADWREKEAERLAREKQNAERFVSSSETRSRILERSLDPTLRLIPVKSAPISENAPAPVAAALPSSGSQNPAGKPNSDGAPGLPPPSSTPPGSGGDDELSSLRARLGLQQAFEGLGSAASGKNLYTDGGVLLDRMKQIEALRAKREEKSLEQQRERATWGTSNRATLASFLAQYKDKPEVVEALRALEPAADTSKQSDFLKNVVGALTTPPKVAGIQATTKKTGAQGDVAAATATAVPEKVTIAKGKLAEDIRRNKAGEAIRWAALNRASAQAAQKAAQDLANTGASRAEQKDIDGQLENIQKIVKGGSYTPLIASLEQADKAIADLGAPPSAAAQMKHALPGGDRFLSPQEKAYYTSTDKLRQMDQLAVSGKVVSEPERAEFLRQYGANWYASPNAAAAYIDMLRVKTANQLNSDLATVRASPSGRKALAAYERQPGAVTPMHPVFKGAGTVSAATGPTESQIAKLKARPDMAAEFDKKFGPGAAAKILGGP